jgi:formylglycine-generating enzyme required for sulfatase activity
MSDIFISYKREEQATARKLADALEKEGWSVWWDPKLRAGEHFDDVIEKALNEAKCVIVMWSNLSVNSEYIKAEATEALEQKKLVPVKIENVNLPFRFKRVQTPSLINWDGSRDSPDFRKFVGDISAILSDSSKIIPDHTKQAEEERLREQERQRSEEEVRRKTDEADRKRIEQEVPSPWRTYGPVAAAVAVLLILFSFVFWSPKPQEAPIKEAEGQKEPIKEAPTNEIVPAAPEIIRVFRDHLKTGREGPEMVVIPAGSFRMGDLQGDGSKDELPVRTVRIEQRFAIGRYEVTFEEYEQFATATKHQLPDDRRWGRGRQPVINVSWQDAVNYTKWLSEQAGKRYRLPSEAEWEYAARGGKEAAYWWGKHLLQGMANCNGCGSQWDGKQTAPVGSFKPNPFGLNDTAGNVWEWVEDCWHDNYNSAPADSSAWKEAGGGYCARRVIRGGSWITPGNLRSSVRYSFPASNLTYDVGFRLARDLD